MAEWIRKQATPAETLGSIPSTHTTTTIGPVPGNPMPIGNVHLWLTDKYAGRAHINKNKS